MPESSKQNVRCTEKDVISELPPNIQETILCFLPIQDAVRTSILSRKWRHCWTMIPHLIFENQFLNSIWHKLSQYDDQELMAQKIVSVINKALLLHNGPILKFSLTIPAQFCDAQIIHDFIDQWIPLFARNGMKQLTLEDSELQELTPHHFSSLDLSHLRLINVWFSYSPASGGFTYLTNLELLHATSNFGQGIFDCPVLQKLTLIFCKGLLPTNFHAPRLKCLHQIYREITSEYSLEGLENLTEYSFILLHISIKQTETFNLVKVLGCLHKIEKFSIGKDFIKYLGAGGSPKKLPKPLPSLKTINFCDITFADLSEVSCLLCLIRSAPNLCKLHIRRRECSGEENLNNYWIGDSEDCTLDHLEIVIFSNFTGLKTELALVKFLLGHSPFLKTMFIHRYGYFMNESVALRMTEEMLQYSRASSRAQIRHLEYPVKFDCFDFELWTNLSGF
ncbi:FBD domain-containing protein [Heracleum sosnowskyi]|uniref:FBD domain-containing protein n=1 Tax=Heracleum sosnowskyi TaxID=360622 RepID=A0AAD8GWQ2_9APIA|nr:FBD domain-containing protein [Heracleum sosnowskyi]